MQITTHRQRSPPYYYCNRLSPKCKSQQAVLVNEHFDIVTDYRLNANHNKNDNNPVFYEIVTDYRLNANHNLEMVDVQHYPL